LARDHHYKKGGTTSEKKIAVVFKVLGKKQFGRAAAYYGRGEKKGGHESWKNIAAQREKECLSCETNQIVGEGNRKESEGTLI